MKENILIDKSIAFAARIINLHRYLIKTNPCQTKLRVHKNAEFCLYYSFFIIHHSLFIPHAEF